MKKDKQKPYISPEVEILETEMSALICQSGGINSMNREEDSEW